MHHLRPSDIKLSYFPYISYEGIEGIDDETIKDLTLEPEEHILYPGDISFSKTYLKDEDGNIYYEIINNTSNKVKLCGDRPDQTYDNYISALMLLDLVKIDMYTYLNPDIEINPRETLKIKDPRFAAEDGQKFYAYFNGSYNVESLIKE